MNIVATYQDASFIDLGGFAYNNNVATYDGNNPPYWDLTLPAGRYQLSASWPGFVLPSPATVTATSGGTTLGSATIDEQTASAGPSVTTDVGAVAMQGLFAINHPGGDLRISIGYPSGTGAIYTFAQAIMLSRINATTPRNQTNQGKLTATGHSGSAWFVAD